MSGIGGRLQSIYKTADGNIAGVDATTQIPLSYNSENSSSESYGYKTIGIPGVVAGLIKLHEEHGVLDLKTVMTPSIRYAEEGYMILTGEAKRQASVKNIIESFDGTKLYFLNSEGDSFMPGDIVFQKDLANTLRSISENGKAGFYEGEVAEKIVNDIQSNGGLITLEDLKNYSALDSKVLTGNFKGYDIHSLYLPSYGAITIQILQILDNLKIESEKEWAIKISTASKRAFEYRYHQNNPDSLKSILSYDNAMQIANEINNDNSLFALKNKSDETLSSNLTIGHTTHLTAADQNGNVVAITQTLGPNMGSKVATKGLGFLYNVTMGPYLGGYLGEDQPGDRVSSHISPTLFTNGDEVVLALGAAGGQRIITAITQVAYRYLAQKIPLSDALFFPRVYKDDGILYIENHLGVNRINAQLFPSKYNV
jgi:gamma-glutamyltranspeptidase/glutathione hydrolase